MNTLYCTKNIDLSKLLHTIGDAICLCDNNMIFVAVNQRLADFYGKKASELIGKSVFEFLPDFKNSVFFEASNYTLKTGKPATRIGYSNSLKKHIVVRTFKFDDNHGVWYAHTLENGFDKTCYVDKYDNLTSLYNRFTFEEDLYLAAKEKKNFGVFILDINKFKQINETFNYSIGDSCLMEIGARVKQAISKSKVYRIGPNQFAAIVQSEKTTVIEDINRSLKVFESPFILDGENYYLSCSIGFNYIENFSNNIADIINQTEYALTKAKKFNNQYVENDDSYKHKDSIKWAKDLKKALINNELEIFYQPQIDTITHKVCGAEALIRWNHPEKGLVPPFTFLGIAEEYGLIEEIDRWVLLKAIDDIYEFSNLGLNIPIAVNFSAKTICSARTIPLITEALVKINPKLLSVEITETSLMENVEKSKETINILSNMGIHIAIDDFGTGYSSMGYLMRYPTDYLKIDREFIKNIDTNEPLKIMTGNIIKLGHSLSMTVVAEGVETMEELMVLKSFDCDVIQGYFFSKPIPKIKFLEYLHTTRFSSLKSEIN